MNREAQRKGGILALGQRGCTARAGLGAGGEREMSGAGGDVASWRRKRGGSTLNPSRPRLTPPDALAPLAASSWGSEGICGAQGRVD